MTHPASTTRGTALLIAVALAAATLAPAPAAAQGGSAKKKQPAGTSSQQSGQRSGSSGQQANESPQQILRKVDARLLAYDTAKARELLAKVPDQGSAKARLAAGRILTLEGALDAAATELSQAAAAAPGDPWPAVYLAEAYALARKNQEASTALGSAAGRAEAAVSQRPDDVEALLALGQVRQMQRRLPEAQQALEKAATLAPNDADVLYRLGTVHALAQSWQPAVDRLTEALGHNEQIAYAYFYRGVAADKLGRKDMLLNDMHTFLALAPNAPDAPRARRILQSAGG